MNYNPNTWVMLEIKNDGKTYYKIFGGWGGGYLDGDSWRMNSGVESVTEDDDYYYFKGASGSVYQCYKKMYGIRGSYCGNVLNSLLKNGGDQVRVVDEEEDFMNIDYSGIE